MKQAVVVKSDGRFMNRYSVRVRWAERPDKKPSKIKLKSLILAQIERWRHALHMQVERQHGSNPGGEWRTGE
jgi:hypothetical protein